MQGQWSFWQRTLCVRLAAAASVILLSACSTMSLEWGNLSTGPQINLHVPPTLTEQLEKSEPCCRSLAELPYQPIDRQGSVDVIIGNDAPSFAFTSGKSRFAAFRLPDWPRPLSIRLDSYSTAEPGGLGNVIPELRGLIFHPVVLILDAQFRVIQRHDGFHSRPECRTNRFFPALSGEFEIDARLAAAAYLVIMTSDAWRNEQGAIVCGATVHGFSPIGKLELTVGSLGFGDGRIAYRGPYSWFGNAHGSDDVGLFSGMFGDAGILLVTGDGIHFVAWTRQGYVERWSVANERIVSVNSDDFSFGGNRLLVIGIAGAVPGEIEYHTFSPQEHSVPATVEAQLQQRIRSGRVVEKLGMAMAEVPPSLNVVESRRPSPAMQRIGDSAMRGGVIVAMPCGICQVGGCTPELLAPCAALFAVGSLVGGVVGIGSEIIDGEASTKPVPDRPEISPPVVVMPGESAAQVAGTHFQQCLTTKLRGVSGGHANSIAPWISQGRRAEVDEIAWEGPADGSASDYRAAQRNGYRFVAETRIEAVDLLAEGLPGQAVTEMPVRLQILGKVRFLDLSRRISRNLPLKWQSDPRGWAEWSANIAGMLEGTLAQACESIARQVVEQTEASWRSW